MQRQSNIELLRIVAMSFILILHFLTKTIGIAAMNPYFFQALVIANICGVNLFILISGYWGIKASIPSFIKLGGLIVFFQLAMLLSGVILFDYNISLINLLRTFALPFSGHYWFLECYLGLFILSPLLNKGLDALTVKELRNTAIILTIISMYSCWLGRNCIGMNGYNLFHFIYLYILGHFLRYGRIFNLKVVHWFLIGLLSMVMNFALTGLADYYFGVFDNLYFKGAIAYNSPFVLLTSISIFMCFAGLRIKDSKWINSVGSASLGCYLLQDAGEDFIGIDI